MLLVILTLKNLLQHFMKKNCENTNQKEFRIENVIKRKGDKLYINWKGYDNSFNSWLERCCYIKMSYFPPYGHN